MADRGVAGVHCGVTRCPIEIEIKLCFFNHFCLCSGGRVLQIPRAQAEDSGRYTCVAVNEAGEDSIQYDVRVLCKYSVQHGLLLDMRLIQ